MGDGALVPGSRRFSISCPPGRKPWAPQPWTARLRPTQRNPVRKGGTKTLTEQQVRLGLAPPYLP